MMALSVGVYGRAWRAVSCICILEGERAAGGIKDYRSAVVVAQRAPHGEAREIIRTSRSEHGRAEQEEKRNRELAGRLRGQQTEDRRAADDQRRTASQCRAEIGDVIGGGSVGEDVPVPGESLEVLRTSYRTAAAAYERTEVGNDLRVEVDRLSRAESEARAAVEKISQEVRNHAEELLLTPDGSDISARTEAAARCQRRADSFDARFEKVIAPVRRQMLTTDRERLPDFAAEWEAALRPRFRVLTDELEQIERHRDAIIERLLGMVKHALGRLRAAQHASKLPADFGDWSGLEFLRIAFSPPEEAVMTEILGQVVDDAAVTSSGKDRDLGKRDGLSILLSGVRACLRSKGVRVDMLKPDAVLRDERVRVAEMADVFSGGQLLTAAIILYCTMAWLRASERGQAQRPHAGVLFLDNPIGRASAGYLLDLQMTVAKKPGVQLVYTTGLFDTNALSVFPLIVRLRNDADLRAGMKYLRVDEEIQKRLPDTPPDETGVLSASRLYVRADTSAS
jgi:hypothetical protein